MTPVNPSGTEAKEIALHFINVTSGRATSSEIARTIKQVKTLLQSNYTKKEIMDAIDYALNVDKVNMYSFGYISININRLITRVAQREELRKAREYVSSASEVKIDGESSQRNRDKARRFNLQSGFREKHNFDLFEK